MEFNVTLAAIVIVTFVFSYYLGWYARGRWEERKEELKRFGSSLRSEKKHAVAESGKDLKEKAKGKKFEKGWKEVTIQDWVVVFGLVCMFLSAITLVSGFLLAAHDDAYGSAFIAIGIVTFIITFALAHTNEKIMRGDRLK